MIIALIFLIILGLLVLSHELGHFLVAKWTGMRVDEFGFGFPPRIFSFKRGETTYSFNLIPFGGFVKIYGEEASTIPEGAPDRERSFVSKPARSQAAVTIAGVFANLLLAWVILSITLMIGLPTSVSPENQKLLSNVGLVVTGVTPGSPADKAHITFGDTIVGLDVGGERVGHPGLEDIPRVIAAHPNEPILVFFMHEGKQYQEFVAPVAGLIPDRMAIGISMDMIGLEKHDVLSSLGYGVLRTAELTKNIFLADVNFIKGLFVRTSSLDAVAGPVGIAGMVGEAWRLGLSHLLSFVAVLSVSLAVLNLIPFPALDGGRLLFILIEKIKGSPIKPSVSAWVNGVGFALLILLMLFVTYKDILKLFAH